MVMRRPWWLGILLIGLILTVPALSAVGDDPVENAALLKEWSKNEPKHYQRLKDDLRAFRKYDAVKQQRMIDFDKELHKKDEKTQEHLWRVLERYHDWEKGLSAEKKDELRTANAEERLNLIRTWRQEDSINRLPRQLAGAIRKLPADQQVNELEKAWGGERQLRPKWIDAKKVPWTGKPERLSEFPDEVQTYVRDVLTPNLTPKEKNDLQAAEGRWPNYAQTIWQLVNKQHPRYPPRPDGEVADERRLRQVLQPDAMKLLAGGALGHLANYKDKWPEYALQAIEVLRINSKSRGKELIIPRPLGASKLEDFPRELQEFINRELIPVLKKEDEGNPNSKLMESLRKNEGLWPEYPKRILQLADRYGIVIPGMSIPGPPELWRAANTALPGG
jgi:hypothetical protein